MAKGGETLFLTTSAKIGKHGAVSWESESINRRLGAEEQKNQGTVMGQSQVRSTTQ